MSHLIRESNAQGEQLAVDHREHNPSRTMRRDEAASSLPPSRPCWSVGIISEPISANGNLSAILSLSLCDPFPTSGGGKTRRGEKIGKASASVFERKWMFRCFFPFFFPHYCCRGFRLLSRLGNDTVFWIFGDWKFRWI